MKLDVNALRYLARDDFRTLTAVEQGERNVSGCCSMMRGAGLPRMRRVCRVADRRSRRIHISLDRNQAATLHSTSQQPPLNPQQQHEIVPVPLIDAIAGLRHGSTVRCLRTLAKAKLVHHDNSK